MSKSNISIMSLNLLTSGLHLPGNPPFKKRIKSINEMIHLYKPDVIGVQELTEKMTPYLDDLLQTYSISGEPRHSKVSNESCCILFNKEKFELLEERTIWLSNTPLQKGSKHPLSQFPRIVSYVYLKDKKTNQTYSVYNTHLDSNFSLVRSFQAQALSQIIQDTQKGTYTILTGDFNCNSLSHAYKIIQAPFIDLIDDSFGTTLRGIVGSLRFHHIPIDHIFVSKNLKSISTKRITSKFSGMYPSDHYPVFTKIQTK